MPSKRLRSGGQPLERRDASNGDWTYSLGIEIQAVSLRIRLRSGPTGPGDALGNPSTGPRRQSGSDEVLGSLTADARVTSDRLCHQFWIQPEGQIGELVDDDVRLHRCHHERQRRRVEYIDNDGLDAGGLELSGFRLRPGRPENFVIGIDQHRPEPTADRSRRSSKKNFTIHSRRSKDLKFGPQVQALPSRTCFERNRRLLRTESTSAELL